MIMYELQFYPTSASEVGFSDLCFILNQSEKAASFDRRSTSFQSEKLLRNFARTSFLICSAQMNEVALRANGKEHLSHIGATILHPNTKALFYKAFSVF